MRYCRTYPALWFFLFTIFLGFTALGGFSEGYMIPTDVINGGGKEGTSASYKLYDSAGQPAIGDLSTSASYNHFTGFWYTVYPVEPDFTIDVLPDTQKVEIGDTADYEVVLTSIAGFSSPCSLSVSGTPPGATSHFDPDVVTPTDTSTLRIATGQSTPIDTSVLMITAKSNQLIHDKEVILIVTSPCPKWSVPLTITGMGVTNTRIFGVHCNGTNGYDSGLDTLIPPPGFDFYSYFLGAPPFNYLSTDIRSSDSTHITWNLVVTNNNPDSSFAVSWSLSDLPDSGCLTMADSIDMRMRDSATFCCGNMMAPIHYEPCIETLIVVTSPNGGEHWCVGDTHNITWTCSGSTNAKIEYSANGGSSWMPIIANTPCGGTHPWVIPDTPSSNCLVRICDTDGTPCDTSDGPFTIDECECVWVTLPDTICVSPGETLIVPVNVSDVTGEEIYAVEMCLVYDGDLLSGNCDLTTTQGTIAQGWGDPTCNATHDSICIAMAGVTPLSGSGVLVYVGFVVADLANQGETTSVCFETMEFNEGIPAACTNHAFVEVCVGFDITGNISHCSNGIPVESTLVYLIGDASDSCYTDGNGYYEFLDLPAGDYVTKPEKEDDQGNAISAFDASIVLRCVVGLLDCGPCSLIAGDVSCNCGLSAYDASLILRYVVGIISEFPCGKDWTFVPSSYPLSEANWCPRPESLAYVPLASDHYNEDYIGIVLGDVSGNWSGKGGIAPGKLAPAMEGDPFEESPSEIFAHPGEEFILPLQAKDISDVYSVELTIEYDPHILDATQVRTSELTKGYLLERNLSDEEIKVAMAGKEPISGSGTIIEVVFNTRGDIETGKTEVIIGEFQLNEQKLEGLNKSVKVVLGKSTPKTLSLSQNFPNPFNPETIIQFSISEPTQVRVEILNLLGQKVATLVDGNREPGNYWVRWDGTDNQGNAVANGIYFYRLVTEERTIVRKMVLMK
jgi:hypothetical protein